MNYERIKAALADQTPAPVHAKLRQAIQDQIMDGSLTPGQALPSERALQKEFSLSRTTVRQAINRLMQEGLLQSVAGTGTFVLERLPRPAVPALIATIVSGANFNFFYPHLLATLSEIVRKAGYPVTMALHNERTETLEATVEELLAQHVVGLVVTPPRLGAFDHLLEQWAARRLPIVCIGRRIHTPLIDCAVTDNANVGYRAAQTLIEMGHRSIMHVGLTDYTTGQDRAAGYFRAMHEAGLTPHILSVQEHISTLDAAISEAPREHLAEPAARAVIEHWERADVRPTAIFAFNDMMAMGIYKALRWLNVRIPHDVSLISVDDLVTVHHFEVPLTTFQLPSRAIGEHAADMLLNRLRYPASAPRQLMLPARLIMRESTAPPAH